MERPLVLLAYLVVFVIAVLVLLRLLGAAFGA